MSAPNRRPPRTGADRWPRILHSSEFVAGFQPPNYTIDGISLRGACYALTAHTGHGKTNIALHATYCTATGTDFAGHEVQMGRVLYLAGENPTDIRMRWLLMADRLAFDPKSIDVNFIDTTGDIQGEFPALFAAVDDIGPVEFVVVDTFAAWAQLEGDQENQNAAIGRFARACRQLTTLRGNPCVWVCCHPPKGAGADGLVVRGGGAAMAEFDGNLTAYSDDGGETCRLHWQRKLRGPDFEPLYFANETGTAETLKDAKGRNIPSTLARALYDHEVEQREREQRRDDEVMLAVMLDNPGASIRRLCEAAEWYSAGKPAKSRAHRVLQRLMPQSVEKTHAGYRLTQAGEKAAKQVADDMRKGMLP